MKNHMFIQSREENLEKIIFAVRIPYEYSIVKS